MADIFKNTAAKFIVFAFDSTTNLPKSGDAANITAYVSKDYGAVTVLADTTATELDATNCKGYYIFDSAQAETNADCLLVSAKSSTANIVVIGAPAVIFTRPTTGYLAPATLGRTLVVDASGLADANTVKIGPTGSGTAQTARDVGASVLLSTGTGTGQLDFTSGVVKANLAQILGTALTETAGLIAAGFKQFFNIASPTSTMNTITTVTTTTTATNLTNAATSGDLTATMKTSVTTAATAATPTAAAVTGAVGSVTGNVGGNVVGSVGSVSGAVGSVTGAVGSISSGGITDASFAAGTGKKVVRANTAAAGAGSSITLDASASATDSIYNGELVYLTGGTGIGQARTITGYVGSTQVATVDRAWQTNPDNTTTFAILPADNNKLDSSLRCTDVNSANLDAAITTRMATYTQPTGFLAATFPGGTVANTTNITAGTITTATNLTTNNDKTGYTIASGGIGSGAHAAAELNNIADGCLDRRLDLGTDSGGNTTTSRTWRQALFGLRNKATIIAGTGTIYKCNDTTVSHTMAMGTTPGDPLSSQDPA